MSTSLKLEARAYPIAEPKNNTLAFASVNIGDAFAVHGLRVMDGEKGKFVAMPSTKDAKGEYRDVFHPITGDMRKELSAAVMSAYESSLEKAQERPSVREEIRNADKAKANAAPTPARENSKKKSAPEL